MLPTLPFPPHLRAIAGTLLVELPNDRCAALVVVAVLAVVVLAAAVLAAVVLLVVVLAAARGAEV